MGYLPSLCHFHQRIDTFPCPGDTGPEMFTYVTHLTGHQQDDTAHNEPELSKEQAHADLHTHSHEEQAHEQAFVGRYVALHLQRILCLCDQ